MENKVFYIKRLLSTLGVCVIGLILSKTVFAGFGLYNGSVFMTTILFAGLPFGWMAMRIIFGGLPVWGFLGICFYYFLMLLSSFAIGWMILGYRLIRDAVQLGFLCWAERKSVC